MYVILLTLRQDWWLVQGRAVQASSTPWREWASSVTATEPFCRCSHLHNDVH